MGFLQWLLNLAFFLIVAGTIIFSLWMSRKYKERYAQFPWYKAAIVIVVEIVAWVLTNAFMDMVRRHPWLLAIAIVVIIVVLMKRKKNKERII
jgi:uncharacterized membrane protein